MLKNIFLTQTDNSKQRGDTIIEVLIAIAVVSLVLAGAYSIANRNVSTTQDTQEHGQALFIVQQQIEGLRALSAAGTDLTAIFPAQHCVSLSATPAPASGAPCNISASGGACGSAACYKIDITQPSPGIYEVTVTWDSVRGGATSRVSMDYGI